MAADEQRRVAVGGSLKLGHRPVAIDKQQLGPLVEGHLGLDEIGPFAGRRAGMLGGNIGQRRRIDWRDGKHVVVPALGDERRTLLLNPHPAERGEKDAGEPHEDRPQMRAKGIERGGDPVGQRVPLDLLGHFLGGVIGDWETDRAPLTRGEIVFVFAARDLPLAEAALVVATVAGPRRTFLHGSSSSSKLRKTK